MGSTCLKRVWKLGIRILSVDGNLSESDTRKGKRGSDMAKLIGEGLGTSWDGSEALKPEQQLKNPGGLAPYSSRVDGVWLLIFPSMSSLLSPHPEI